jgi:hypothetical protein
MPRWRGDYPPLFLSVLGQIIVNAKRRNPIHYYMGKVEIKNFKEIIS